MNVHKKGAEVRNIEQRFTKYCDFSWLLHYFLLSLQAKSQQIVKIVIK
jgi:hypothetical protein